MKIRKEVFLGLSIGVVLTLLMMGIGFFVYAIFIDKDNEGTKTITTTTVEQTNIDKIEEGNGLEKEDNIIEEDKQSLQEGVKEEGIIITQEYFPLHEILSYRTLEGMDMLRQYIVRHEGKKNIGNKEVYVISSDTIHNNQVIAQLQYFYSINDNGNIYRVGEKNDKGIKWKPIDKQEIVLFGKMKEGDIYILENNEFIKHSFVCVGFKDVTLPNGDYYENTLQVNDIMEFPTYTFIRRYHYYKGVGLVYLESETQQKDGKVNSMITYVPKDSIYYEEHPGDAKFMSEEEILNIVVYLDEVQKIEAPEISLEIVVYPTNKEPIYKVKVFEDLGSHITTYNYFLLDGKTGEVLSKDF